jgi:DNA-binding transcriptional LysR family regulator
LRLSEVATLLTIRKLGSLAKAARELDVTASQVSKSVVRLEPSLRSRRY